LERVQSVTIPDESEGSGILRNFLETVFDSLDSFNFRVETDFLPLKVALVKGKVSLDAMQTYVAKFAETLEDWLPRFPDPDDRALNKRLVAYFYNGIEPEPLRSLIKHFPVAHISEAFPQFQTYCTAPVVEMANLKTEKSLRDRQFRSRQQLQQIPEQTRPLGGERKAKKVDSAGAKPNALFEEVLPIFDCGNCGGTHKSMNCKSKCRLCKSKGLDDDHPQFHCPKIPNAKEHKQNQQPRKVASLPSLPRSVKSATSRSTKPAGSVISAMTQDDESFAEDDSEVRHDYPVWVDTCASDVYTPSVSDLDPDSFSIHSRVTDQLKVEQADGTKLFSSGVGKFAGAPAYVMPDMSETLLGANVVCKLGNLMLVDHEKIICVGSDASTRASLSTFYEFIRQNKDLVKFTAFADNGCYKVLRSKIRPLNSKKYMAKLISRYETVQFSDLYHFVRFWHEAMGHADIKTMLLVATRIISHPSEFRGFPREFTPAIIRKYFPVTCHSCPLGNLNRRPSIVSTDTSTPREILPG
jgi:hypothetical protein